MPSLDLPTDQVAELVAYPRRTEIMAMPLAEGLLARERSRLLEIWETAPGIYGWFATVDHKRIGVRYLCTAFFFLLLGGCEALMMRLQLAQPNLGFCRRTPTINCSRCTASR